MYNTQFFFKNYPQFIKELQKAIQGERDATLFYQELLKVAPTENAQYALEIAIKDEKEHYQTLQKLLFNLTGEYYQPQNKEIKFKHFYDGLQISFFSELEAFEMYKMIYLSTYCPTIRDIFYEIQNDEIKHASLFNWVQGELH